MERDDHKTPARGECLVKLRLQRLFEVLKLVAEGRSNREIGERLHTSRHTVANQIHSILTKTGCANRVEAVTWATRRDLIGL